MSDVPSVRVICVNCKQFMGVKTLLTSCPAVIGDHKWAPEERKSVSVESEKDE